MDGSSLLTAIMDNDLATIKLHSINPFARFTLAEIYKEEPCNLVSNDFVDIFYLVISSEGFENIMEWFLSSCIMTVDRKDWEGSIYHGARNRKVKNNPKYIENNLQYRRQTRERNIAKLKLFHNGHSSGCSCCRRNTIVPRDFINLRDNMLKYPFLSTITAFDEIRKDVTVIEDLECNVRSRIRSRLLWKASRTFCIVLVFLPLINDVKLHIANLALRI